MLQLSLCLTVMTLPSLQDRCVLQAPLRLILLARAAATAAATAAAVSLLLLPHLALAHGHAGAVPEALRHLSLLVIVVPAGAQRGTQLVLVLSQALDDDCGH